MPKPILDIILVCSSTSAKAWMILLRAWPSLSRAPCGAIFMVVLLTNLMILPFLSQRQKDRSSMDQNAFELYGIAAIGDIFNWGSGFSLMSPQKNSLAWPALTFLMLFLAK